MPETDRYLELCAALESIRDEIVKNSKESDSAALGALLVARLYEEFPDMTPSELDALSHVYGRREH